MNLGKTIIDYELIEEIGRGAFGTVYKAIRKDGKIIALKVIDIPMINKATQEKIIQTNTTEVDYLKKLSEPKCNPFVICYYNSYYNPERRQFLIEMEYIEGKDMRMFIKEEKEKKSTELINYYILSIAKDLAQGLTYIHSKNIIHGDIKLENIMIDKTFTPRIIDFGLSCIPLFENCGSLSGTPWYMAPDLLNLKVKTLATDMWALGVLLYFATTGEFPYRAKTISELLSKIKKTLPAKLTSDNFQLNNIVNNLLVKDPSKRWTTQDILEELKIIHKPQ